MSTKQEQVKWGKVMRLLSELYELYYSGQEKWVVKYISANKGLAKFLLKVEELMEAYNEWLG